MTDQIAEYRKLMEDRFAELHDSKRVEEETRKSQEMLKIDEEIAKKLQEQYTSCLFSSEGGCTAEHHTRSNHI